MCFDLKTDLCVFDISFNSRNTISCEIKWMVNIYIDKEFY
jgi:hypothetical protein